MVFNTILANAGVVNYRIPKDTIVIQLGDLVHKGPSSAECVNIAQKLINTNPENYIQLVGNHEAHYLGGVELYGRVGVEKIPNETIDILKTWWGNDIMKVAYSSPTQYGDVLFTHGGLTKSLWQELKSPATAAKAEAALNLLKQGSEEVVFREGKLTLGGEPRFNVGPLNARTGAELAYEWLRQDSMPFSQVHGHETLYWWVDDRWHDDVPLVVRDVAKIDKNNKRTHIQIGEKHIFSIDPAFSVQPPDKIPDLFILKTA